MKFADLRFIASTITGGPWFADVESYFIYTNAFTECEIASTQFTKDAAALVVLRNHADALLDLAAAVRSMLEAAEVSTDEVYRRMDTLRQVYAKLEAVQ